MKFMDGFFKNADKKEAVSWAFYDFANSAYSLLILTFVYPIFFRDVIANGSAGDFWWGLSVSLSILIGGLASPIIGAISDHHSRKKGKFILFSILSMIGTASLFFTGANMLVFALALFIVTNLCFQIAQTLYDSFLLNVSTEETAGRISGLGWGLGYLGGIVAMILLKPLYDAGYANMGLYKLTFPLTALFFFIFALPSFVFIKEEKVNKKKEKFFNLVKIGISKTASTLKDVRKHKKIAWFLLGFYILNDALVTIFTFISIYGKTTLHMNIAEISILLLIVQVIGFPATIFFGWLSDNKGSKKILLLTIFLWGIVVVGISLADSKTFFYVMAVMAGLIIGSSQAIARSWFSRIIPKEKLTEFFGFNGFASKVAATTGPLVFGIISTLSGSQRLAMGSLLIYLLASFIIFFKIEE